MHKITTLTFLVLIQKNRNKFYVEIVATQDPQSFTLPYSYLEYSDLVKPKLQHQPSEIRIIRCLQNISESALLIA